MHILALIAGGCMIALTIPTYRLIDAQRKNAGAIERSVNTQAGQTRTFVGEWLTTNMLPPVNKLAGTIDGLPVMIRDLVDKHAARVENKSAAEIRHGIDGALGEIRNGVAATAKAVKDSQDLLDKRTGDGLQRVDRTLSIAEGVRTDAQPVFKSAGSLLEDLIASWDTMFYDVWAMFESATVATTQGAKAMQSVEGIAADFHDATRSLDQKYFHPLPRTGWQKFKDFIGTTVKVGISLLTAALRGGW